MESQSTRLDREQGSVLLPKFDAQGLMSAVVLDSVNRDVLMIAFMDEEALRLTRETGCAHFWSRSRQKIWMKGETSGHVLKVCEMLFDCDQDAVVLLAEPAGPTCHTGVRSCFYRKLESGDAKGEAFSDVLVKVND